MSATNEQLLEKIYAIESCIKEELARGNSVEDLKKDLERMRALFNESATIVASNEKLLKG